MSSGHFLEALNSQHVRAVIMHTPIQFSVQFRSGKLLLIIFSDLKRTSCNG